MTLAPASQNELSNGRYLVSLNDAGCGLSKWDWIALNRWAGDAVNDTNGFFLYLRDLDSGDLWSAGLQPAAVKPSRYRRTSTPDHINLEREDHGITSLLTVSVAADQACEYRRLRLRNHSGRPRRIEVTSYIEVALAHPQGDLVHPAFSKLFVQTDLRRDTDGGLNLIAQRRPRGHGEHWPTIYHRLDGAEVGGWETDRLRFIGRGRSLAHPAATQTALSGTLGNVLDPILSLRTLITLAPGEHREVCFSLGVAEDTAAVAALGTAWAGPPPSAAPADTPAAPTPRFRSDFNSSGDEYRMRLPWTGDGLDLPPMPWINVIANERFGMLLSETGAGGCWARNSQAYRLTPWGNDPVCDPHGEALYLRDEDHGNTWSPLPGPKPAPADYDTAHGFGYTRHALDYHGLQQTTTQFIARSAPLKFVQLQIHNHGTQPRRLSLFAYQQLVLGTLPEPATLRTERDGEVLCARSTRSDELAGGIVFSRLLGGDIQNRHYSCDRSAFFDTFGNLQAPQALQQRTLDDRCDSAALAIGDPCFVQQVIFALAPGATTTLCLLLGAADDTAEYTALLAAYADNAAVAAAYAEACAAWREPLQRLRVQTPVPAIDHMVNGWLPYEALSCRIWGRTAFYQSSGAYGYRDQLQDAHNLTLLWPQLTRAQLLLHAAHQFEEGDVLHWWHAAPIERGLRTRFSDDLLWLPYATAQYLHATGDHTVLDTSAPFLRGEPLAAGEDERYLKPTIASDGSLYEHCCRALDRSLTRGAHGLPLMGTGDWNDGMNRVGREGRGESVWLGFFLAVILADFIPLAAARGDAARAQRYADYRSALVATLNDSGWDGQWYRRAYYDDGTPLGTHDGGECRIDGLAQAWAVLSDVAPPARAALAMDALEAQLVHADAGLICLLTPPFVDTPHDPGYIRGYVAGVRENGGQYTHASCWMIAALAKLGRRDRAASLLERLSPQWHSRDDDAIDTYKVEPYVIAADIYGAAPHIGRGGWTWYTGSAGWAYRVALESILGLRMENGDTLCLSPCIPDEWPAYTIDYQRPDAPTHYRIEVQNPTGCTATVIAAELDGTPIPIHNGQARWPLSDDGATHLVRITLGAARQ